MHIPLWLLQSLYSSLSLPGNCITGFCAARGCPGKHSHPSGFSSEPHPPPKQGIAGRLCKKTSAFPLKTACRRRRSGGGAAPGRERLTPGPGSSHGCGASSPPDSRCVGPFGVTSQTLQRKVLSRPQLCACNASAPACGTSQPAAEMAIPRKN